MSVATSGLAQQAEIEERVERLQELFANDPEIARIHHRFAEDWSGDYSLFIEVVLNKKAPTAATVVRLSREFGAQLLRVVRSEELGLHSYFNFSSKPENDQ